MNSRRKLRHYRPHSKGYTTECDKNAVIMSYHFFYAYKMLSHPRNESFVLLFIIKKKIKCWYPNNFAVKMYVKSTKQQIFQLLLLNSFKKQIRNYFKIVHKRRNASFDVFRRRAKTDQQLCRQHDFLCYLRPYLQEFEQVWRSSYFPYSELCRKI